MVRQAVRGAAAAPLWPARMRLRTPVHRLIRGSILRAVSLLRRRQRMRGRRLRRSRMHGRRWRCIRRRRFRRNGIFVECRRWRRRDLRYKRHGGWRRGRLARRRRGDIQLRPAFVAVFRAIKVIRAAVITSDHRCNSLRSSENSRIIIQFFQSRLLKLLPI